ncbi:MAG: DUF5050 domain-containing protein [Nanoarchaeota archaeon]
MHRKYLDDVVRECYSANFFSKAMNGIRRYSSTALAIGALEVGSFLGGCVRESEAAPKPEYEQKQTEQEARIDGWTRIAFVSDRDGNSEIYVMNADGTDEKRLTNNLASDLYPSWSPDGKRIAFTSDRCGIWNPEIYVMDADGGNQKKLTNNPPINVIPSWINIISSWSPDGKKIVFESTRYGNSEIYVMDADGGNPERLTNNPAADREPSYSSDGNKIAFMSNRDGNPKIYIMDSDGSNQKRLTNNSAGGWNPSWSHDGKKIAFESARDGNNEIYVMNADGSNQKNLTDNPSSDESPSWSPDGKSIAFMSNRDGNFEIYMMGADGGNPERLIKNSACDGTPSWSPFLPPEIKAEKEKNESEEIFQWFKSPEGKYRIPAITEKGWTYILRPSNLINPEGKIELPKAGVDQFFRRYEKDESELVSLLVKWLPVTGTLEEEFAQSKRLLVERDKWRWVEGSLTTIKIGDENGLQGKYIVDVSEANKKLLTTYMLVHRGSRAYEIVFTYTNRFPDPSQTLEKIVKNWQFTNGKK